MVAKRRSPARKHQAEKARGVKRYYESQKPPRKNVPRGTSAESPKPMTIMGLDDTPALRDPYARRLELPRLPTGHQPGSGMAFDDAGPCGPGFPFQNYLGAGNAFSLYFPGYPYLAMLSQRSEYRQPVETHAKDMTREWIEFKSRSKQEKGDRIKQLENRFLKLGIQELIRKGLVHDGFFGVGHIFIDLEGHDDAELPVLLDPKSIPKGSLRGFQNIEPMWVTPIVWEASDATSPDFYVPETWYVLSRRVHKTRLLQILSREVPDILKPAYNFGGLSLSQLIEPYVDRWLKTVAGVNRLINNFSLIALKTDMSAVLSGGPDSDLRKRMKLARQYGDNMGMFVMDMTKEELMQIAVPLSGLSELQAQAQEHMAAPTHLPLVVLTGITPSGLNASSDGEIEVYHDWNRSEQYAVLRKVLTHILHVVMLDMWGEIDEDITFGFKPIKQVTGEALARIKKTEAEQDTAYIDAGVVDAQEVREKVARDPDSGYSNLDVSKEIIPPDEKADPDDEGEHGAREDEPEELEAA
jgi:uncharacterized protein